MTEPKHTSHAIVSFVSSLLPLYRPEYVAQETRARSLRDGTVIKPVAEPIEDEDGRVEVWWQGNSANATVEHGVFVARLALSDYVDFHSRGKPDTFKRQMEDLAEHFHLKTGETLADSEDPLLSLLEALFKGVEKMGPTALPALLRKGVGF